MLGVRSPVNDKKYQLRSIHEEKKCVILTGKQIKT